MVWLRYKTIIAWLSRDCVLEEASDVNLVVR